MRAFSFSEEPIFSATLAFLIRIVGRPVSVINKEQNLTEKFVLRFLCKKFKFLSGGYPSCFLEIISRKFQNYLVQLKTDLEKKNHFSS